MPKISASVRKKILEKLLTSPERKKLFEQASPYIEEVLTSKKINPKQAYLYGSFASEKTNPNDIDVMLRFTKKDIEKGLKYDTNSKLRELDLVNRKVPRNLTGSAFLPTPAVDFGVPLTSREATIETGRPYKSWKDTLERAESVAKEKGYARTKAIRILELAGATGGAAMAGGLLEPSEAEAGVAGKAFKLGAKEVFRNVSRTSEGLKGKQFLGKEIKEVMKGKGDTRYIVLTDDTVYPTNKGVISDMIRTAGTAEKMTEFASKKGQVKLDQALRSMSYHESRTNQFATQKTIVDNFNTYTKQMKEAGVESISFSLVRRGDMTYTMPTAYAQLLQKEGHLKILKELK